MSKVTNKDLDTGKIKFLKVAKKTSKQDKNIEYETIGIKYRYPTAKDKTKIKTDDFYWEPKMCTATCPSRWESSTRAKYSARLTFDPTDEREASTIDAWESIVVACAMNCSEQDVLDQDLSKRMLEKKDIRTANKIFQKGKGKKRKPILPKGEDPDSPRSMFINVKFFTKNKDLWDQPDKVHQKATYVKMYTKKVFENGKRVKKLMHKPLRWSDLEGKELRMVPLIHIKSIYCGDRCYIQFELVSAKVYKIKNISTIDRQLEGETIENSEYADDLEEESSDEENGGGKGDEGFGDGGDSSEGDSD